MATNEKKSKFIHQVKKSSLLQIVEKSFPTIYGDIRIKDKDDKVVVEISTPKDKNRLIAKVTFSDYDVKCESEIDFPRNEGAVELRFIDLMMRLFEDKGYRQEWEAAHKDDFSIPGYVDSQYSPINSSK